MCRQVQSACSWGCCPPRRIGESAESSGGDMHNVSTSEVPPNRALVLSLLCMSRSLDCTERLSLCRALRWSASNRLYSRLQRKAKLTSYIGVESFLNQFVVSYMIPA